MVRITAAFTVRPLCAGHCLGAVNPLVRAAPLGGRPHFVLWRKQAHTALHPGALLFQQRKSALARYLKTTPRRQEPGRRAEGQAGKHGCCSHSQRVCSMGRGGQVWGGRWRELCFGFSASRCPENTRPSVRSVVGGEGPAPRLLLCLRRG